MRHHLHRRLRVLAATVLVLMSALGTWSTVAHGIDCHDVEDGPVFVAHDASAHAFRGAALPGGARETHCVLCHWTRTFGPSVQSMPAAPSSLGRFVAAPVTDAAGARLIASVQPPLRAPPAPGLDVLA